MFTIKLFAFSRTFPRLYHVMQVVHWCFCYGVVSLMAKHWISINDTMQVKSAKIDFLNIFVIFQIIVMVVELHHFKIQWFKINQNKRRNIDNTRKDRNTHTRFINEWKSCFKTSTNKMCNSIGVIFIDLFFLFIFLISGNKS